MTSYPVSIVSIHDNRINNWNKVEQEQHDRKLAKHDMKKMKNRGKKVGAKPFPGGRLRNWIGRRYEGQLNSFNRPMF